MEIPTAWAIQKSVAKQDLDLPFEVKVIEKLARVILRSRYLDRLNVTRSLGNMNCVEPISTRKGLLKSYKNVYRKVSASSDKCTNCPMISVHGPSCVILYPEMIDQVRR